MFARILILINAVLLFCCLVFDWAGDLLKHAALMGLDNKLSFDPKTGKNTVRGSYGEKSDVVTVVHGQSTVAVRSDTLKEKNKDGFCEKYIPSLNIHVIAVADGIGNMRYCDVASRFIAQQTVSMVVEALTNGKEVDFTAIFQQAQSDMKEMIEHKYPGQYSSDSFGTTLILGVDYPDRFTAAYVGNGSIMQISGFFSTFSDLICLPWNAINLLNPHTIEQDGREALYKFFSYGSSSSDVTPSVIDVAKTTERPGDIFVITTDGVHSADHDVPGTDDSGQIWIPADNRLKRLYDQLKDYLLNGNEIDDKSLGEMLEAYLEQMKGAGEMDDDTTLGIVVSANARDYFLSERKNRQ